MRIRPNAPRFHTWLERHHGRRVLMMTRDTWRALKLTSGQPALLTMEDLAETGVSNSLTFLAATASRAAERVELSVFRADLGDDPNPINVDTYEVWEDLRSRVHVDKVVCLVSTSTGPNLDRYLDEHVFLVSEKKVEGHHLPALPDDALVLLRELGRAV